MPRTAGDREGGGGRRARTTLPAGEEAGGEPIGGPAASKREEAGGRSLPAGLHVIATPIGNRGDITLRAIETLRAADLIACEDTRISGPFVRGLGAAAPLVAYHDHNAAQVRPQLLARMAAGAAVALVSDAGTPLISDPGYRLVTACIAEGIAVTALPGPSAPLTALVLSGLPTDRFLFAGFLPPKAAARAAALRELAAVRTTLVFFEAPSRLAESLGQMAEELGARPAAVARELTKLYEEVRRGPLPDLARHYREEGPPRGEIVVVIGPPLPDAQPTADEIEARLRTVLGTMRVKDAATLVATETGRPRREVYARALALQAEAERR